MKLLLVLIVATAVTVRLAPAYTALSVPSSPLGIKIGLDAVDRLHAKPRELTVLYHDSDASPRLLRRWRCHCDLCVADIAVALAGIEGRLVGGVRRARNAAA